MYIYEIQFSILVQINVMFPCTGFNKGHICCFLQKEAQFVEKEAALEATERQFGESKHTAQGALYEKEQQLTNLKLTLDKVCRKKFICIFNRH